MKVNCSVWEILVTLRLSVWEILVRFIWAKPGFLSLLCLQTKHHKYLSLHFTVQVLYMTAAEIQRMRWLLPLIFMCSVVGTKLQHETL